MYERHETGRIGEDISVKYLEQIGYTIIERNFECRQGEIDIIAKQKDVLVFVEVKYRKNTLNGHPFEAVTPAKIRKICRAALSYLQIHHLLIDETKIRFDVVGIIGTEIQHLKHAFDYVS